MRNIKFRIWNKKKKEWLFDYPKMGGFALLGEIVLVEGIREIPLTELQNLEVNQFTGLLDKNGKEIYEGDVIVCKTTYGRDEKEVIWDDKRAGFYLKSDFVAYDPKNLFLMSGKKMEVIGNIYENPELLPVIK